MCSFEVATRIFRRENPGRVGMHNIYACSRSWDQNFDATNRRDGYPRTQAVPNCTLCRRGDTINLRIIILQKSLLPTGSGPKLFLPIQKLLNYEPITRNRFLQIQFRSHRDTFLSSMNTPGPKNSSPHICSDRDTTRKTNGNTVTTLLASVQDGALRQCKWNFETHPGGTKITGSESRE